MIGFESGASAPIAFETKIRSITLPPEASADWVLMYMSPKSISEVKGYFNHLTEQSRLARLRLRRQVWSAFSLLGIHAWQALSSGFRADGGKDFLQDG
ncbi:MAG: hypothetical protein OXE74_09085, partial [Cyanobacteria bacterium MAG CAR2_bin_4]|nr:hypothetical protein [Cyanobacteria bacterium MAG CAR2_bin_4]